MEFKRVQKEGYIVAFFVNKKRVTGYKYEEMFIEQEKLGKKYNSSSTIKNKKGNYVHTFYMN